jgi:hypothetical protein
MARPIQPSFAGGEISPEVYGRIDLVKYMTGMKTLNNVFCHVYGGVSNRAGTYFVGEVADSSAVHRLIPFKFNNVQAYALEFGDETMRVIKDGGIVEDGGSPVEIVTPYGAADLANLSYAQKADTLYLVHPDYPPYKVTRTSHVDWSIDAVDFEDGPYITRLAGDEGITITPGARIGNNVTLTASAALFNANMVGHPIRLGYPDNEDPETIVWGYGVIDQYTSSTSARCDVIEAFGQEFIIDPDFENGVDNWGDFSGGFAGGISHDAVNDYMVLTAPATGFAKAGFNAGYVGSRVKLTLEIVIAAVSGSSPTIRVYAGTGTEDEAITNVMPAVIYATTGTKTLTLTSYRSSGSYDGNRREYDLNIYIDTYGSTASDTVSISRVSLTRQDISTEEWRLPAWTEEHGYPRAVTFHEERLVFGGTADYPQTLWFSRVANYENFGFSSPYEDSDAFNKDISSRKVNAVNGLISMGDLIVLTSGSEWRAVGKGDLGVITPTSTVVKAQSYLGCKAMMPLAIGNAVLFVERGGKSIKDLTYSYEVDGFTGSDLTIFANHFFEKYTIEEWDYARLPHSIIWVVRSDGALLGLTYFKEHDIFGWHKHETDGAYESVAVVSSETDDEVYVIVNRTIDGSTVRYIEMLMPRIEDGVNENSFFVDCGLTYDGSPATTISGLDHLEGETVNILADGGVVPSQEVTGGEITLAAAASLVHVGLPITATGCTLNIEIATSEGTSQGKIKSIPSVVLRLKDTRGLWVGPDADHLDELRIRDQTDEEDPIALYTGDFEIILNSGYDRHGQIYFKNEDPIPFTILAVIPEIKI